MARSKVKPHVIGLLGGSGAGKSTVAQILREHGACVIDADQISRDLSAPGAPAALAIREAFGDTYFRENGELDRRGLGELVFRDEGALARLEQVTHPLMAEEITRRLNQSDADLAVLDCAVLLKPAFRPLVDEIWAVTAPEETRQARIETRDSLTAEQAASRIGAQSPEEEMLRVATHVITNTGSRNDLRRAVEDTLQA